MAKTKSDIKSILADRVNNLSIDCDNTTDDTANDSNVVSDNLDLYNKIRSVPPEAQKEIKVVVCQA